VRIKLNVFYAKHFFPALRTISLSTAVLCIHDQYNVIIVKLGVTKTWVLGRMREVDWKRKSQSVFGTAGRSEMRRRNRRKRRRELRKMKTKMG
jgi:hypothetical protein